MTIGVVLHRHPRTRANIFKTISTFSQCFSKDRDISTWFAITSAKLKGRKIPQCRSAKKYSYHRGNVAIQKRSSSKTCGCKTELEKSSKVKNPRPRCHHVNLSISRNKHKVQYNGRVPVKKFNTNPCPVPSDKHRQDQNRGPLNPQTWTHSALWLNNNYLAIRVR